MKIKELEDYPCFPAIFRKFQMEYIGFLVKFLGLYKGISHVGHSISQKNLVDLCSGSGIPAEELNKSWNKNLIKTDKYPYADGVEKLDVLNAQFKNENFYFMSNAFHHFNVKEQELIVKNLMINKCDFMIVEILQPRITDLINVVIGGTVGQVLLAPFIRPFSWKRMLFTYFLPINIISVTYDGIISVLKSKHINDMKSKWLLFSTVDYSIQVEEIDSHLKQRLIIIRGKLVNS